MKSKGTILIVDDRLSAREVLGGVLSGQGYQLVFAENGPEALAKAAELIPDLILLDVMMPGMDGLEVCRRLRADPMLAEVPIVMVTTLDDHTSLLQALEAGADDFISKPFNHAELKARVQTITRLNRYRRLLEERIRRQQAEDEVRRRDYELQLRDKFVSNVSHELRTPLSTMLFLTHNLQSLYPQLKDAKRLKMIHDIEQHIHILSNLVDDVLEISRLDQKRVSTQQQVLDLAKLASEEIAAQAALAQQKNQQLRQIMVKPLTVMGNEGQLRQVIRNLINNAIKYTLDGGWIACECMAMQTPLSLPDNSWPESAKLPDGHWAALRVLDNGVGIAPNDLPHIFERFYRVKHQGAIRGNGLGLSITQELAELHQGHIAVISTPGTGSTFALYLPLIPQE